VESSIEATAALSRLLALDARLARAAAARVSGPVALGFFLAVSRLGDWALSAATGTLLAAVAGGGPALRFAACTAVALAVQKGLKRAFDRTRPCLAAGGPAQRAPIPDAGSFPSGHTLHAVLAAGAVTAAFAPLAVLYVPLALAVATSRVVLGVHYPSDVAAGALLGVALAAALPVA